MIYDCTIIGASHAGLAAAALLAQQGLKVLVLEAHSKVGGCASYFSRTINGEHFSFEVGATSISGYENNKPIAKLLKKLDIEPQFTKLDIGMIIKMQTKTLKRFSNEALWLEELCHFFRPADESYSAYYQKQKNFWQEIHRIDEDAWTLLSQNDSLLPKDIGGYLQLAHPKNLKGTYLSPGLFISLEALLHKHRLIDDLKFRQFIDEQLLISTQSYARDCPYLAGAMGLAYPREVYYPQQSIALFAEQINDKAQSWGAELKLREKVTQINSAQDYYKISSTKAEYFSHRIISAIPIWNLNQIYPSTKLEKQCQKFDTSWGAFTLYLAIESKFQPETAFYQIHCPEIIINTASRSFFCSFSFQDHQRAPQSKLSLSISTHVRPEDWLELDEEKYQRQKKETSEYIKQELIKNIPELEQANILYERSASPKSFMHFTGRHNGFVGGIAHSTKHSLFELTNHQLEDNLFLVGDTSFPGQGLAATIYSAMSAVKKYNQ